MPIFGVCECCQECLKHMISFIEFDVISFKIEVVEHLLHPMFYLLEVKCRFFIELVIKWKNIGIFYF